MQWHFSGVVDIHIRTNQFQLISVFSVLKIIKLNVCVCVCVCVKIIKVGSFRTELYKKIEQWRFLKHSVDSTSDFGFSLNRKIFESCLLIMYKSNSCKMMILQGNCLKRMTV